MSDAIYTSIKEKILQLKNNYPKHYVSMFRKHYLQLWNEIENYNELYFKDENIDSNPQKIYNYLYKITQIPVCPISNKKLKFWDLKFEYRKYAIKGQILPESRIQAIEKLKKNYKLPVIIDFKTIQANKLTFEELKHKFKELIHGPRLSDKLNQLHFQPELSKQIYDFYNKLEPMTACVWLLEHDMQFLPDNWEYYSIGRCCREKMSQYERNKKNKLIKYKNAIVYTKEDTIKKLNIFIKQLLSFQNIKQSLFKYDVNLLKSVVIYTSDMNDIDNKFAERVYFLLYGKPIINNDEQIVVFTTFENGYEIRSKISYTLTGELEIKNWLKDNGYNVKKYKDSKYEIDIYLSDYKLGIEYNGEYWHSTNFKNKNYHIDKTNYFKEKGIKIIHIWDNEWQNKKEIIKSIILSKLNNYQNCIYARKCIIKLVDKLEKDNFLEQNHLQGKDISKYAIGLYYENKLVSIMTFGKRHISKISQFELIRFCNKLNTKVIGGASKLFKYFVANFDINYIKTYADIRFYNNNGFYEKLGFRMINISKPNYNYFKLSKNSGLRLYSRISCQKHKLNKLLENFDPDKTEEQNMFDNGFCKIYDCGNYVFEYIKN